MSLLEQETQRFRGVHLGGLRAFAATAQQLDQRPRMDSDLGFLPPAIVFSALEHGSPRFNDRGPIPLVGAGLGWPEEADGRRGEGGSGRIPIAVLWERLQEGESRVRWRRQYLEASEGLVRALLSIGSRSHRGSAGHESVGLEEERAGSFNSASMAALETCLVIPDALSEARQQALLDASRRLSGREPVLIWRPIAAAFAWLEVHGASLSRPVGQETSLGRLLSLHLGVEGFEACWLELILRPDSPEWILPARGRPVSGCTKPAAGRELLEDVTFRCLSPLGIGDDGERDFWRTVWASPAARQGLLAGTVPHALEAWGVDSALPERLRAGLSTSLLSWVGAGLGGLRGNRDLSAWLRRVQEAGSGSPAVGAVVTGDYANLHDARGLLAARLVAHVESQAAQRVVAEGTSTCSEGALARCAATYCLRRKYGLPTYLDSLPRMETLITRSGLPEWVSLLQETEQYVPGGKPWRRDEPFGPLWVRANSDTLDLSVWIDSEDIVKQVSAGLPSPPPHRVKVHLTVEAEPARGNARVTVVPEEVGALGRRLVELNWREAVPTGKTREQLASEVGVSCPNVQQRGAWPSLWWPVRIRLRALGSRPPLANPDLLRQVRELLRAKPTQADGARLQGGLVSYGVTSSDGALSPQHRSEQPLLDGSLIAMLEGLGERHVHDHLSRRILLACLGHACFDHPRIDGVAERVLAGTGRLGREEATFLGGCLRTPRLIALFAERVCEGLDGGVSGNNDPLKALWYALQYRSDATEQMDSRAAEQVIMTCVRHLERSIRMRRFKYLERHSLVVIAFLMRRRVYDDDFFEPSSEQAEIAKRIMRRMFDEIESRRIIPIGGSVRPYVLLQRVIDFIDRKGSLAPLTA